MTNSIDYAIELHDESTRLEAAGELTAAEARCRQALAIFEKEDGPESPDVANLLHSLGMILEKQGRYDETEVCARRALAIVEPLLPQFDGPDGVLIQLHALGLLGTALRQKGRYLEARPLLERALAIADGLGNEPEEVVTALNNFGMLCKFAGWFDEGAGSYARAMRIILPITGERHETVATLYHNIGGLEHARECYAAAEEPSRKAWEIRGALLGEEHLNAQADAVAYAAVLDGLDRFDESRPIYERALAIYERVLGPEHYEVAATLHNLSVLEQAQGDVERGVALCRRSLELKRKLLGDDHPDTALTLMNLGAMLLDQGQRDEARPLCESALATFRRTLAPAHPHVLLCESLVRQCGEFAEPVGSLT
ncbi:MAG: tetratricopeptide repeat protein [Acidobacteria bacterium]|nr:tetratricopeptide repeat protein [Acidobacteriota bacterium]